MTEGAITDDECSDLEDYISEWFTDKPHLHLNTINVRVILDDTDEVKFEINRKEKN